MNDKKLYYQLLGLEKSWEVTEVKVDFEELKVDIWVEWTGNRGSCAECGKICSVYDRGKEREWRHLDTMQFQTILHCRVPRIDCAEHGIKTMKTPWAELYSRFTLLFERLAINVLSCCSDQTKARRLLRLSWDETHRIQERAVERGLARRKDEAIEYIGVDEKSFLRGHKYATVVSDLERGCVFDVAEERKEASFREILDTMSKEQREGITAVAMDMWEPYINVAEQELPEADIVHDKFHISKFLNEAVDSVRKTENKALIQEGVEALKGTKYLWLKNPDNWTKGQNKLFKELKLLSLKVGRAWAIKEMFSEFWKYVYTKSAEKFFKKWYWWVTHSRLKPLIKIAKTLKEHLKNILTYFKHRITNAVAEGLNSKIQQIKTAARGFRKFENYRIAILFHCGKLDMLP